MSLSPEKLLAGTLSVIYSKRLVLAKDAEGGFGVHDIKEPDLNGESGSIGKWICTSLNLPRQDAAGQLPRCLVQHYAGLRETDILILQLH